MSNILCYLIIPPPLQEKSAQLRFQPIQVCVALLETKILATLMITSNLIIGTACVATLFSGKSQQGSPVLVLAEDVRVANDDEQRLSAGDRHVEPLWV